MPDVIAISSQNVLPLWDSFEATFFVVAGMSVGFVLGYLFPSIWRTLRRRFRPYRQFLISDISLERNIHTTLHTFDSLSDDKTEYSTVEMFVIARDFFQKREFRRSVKVYGEILTSTQATTPHIHQAMFELAQVYFALKLYPRAFDTSFELLKRKPRDSVILSFILKLLGCYFDPDRFKEVYEVYKGNLNEPLKKKMCFIVCKYVEQHLKDQAHLSKAISLLQLCLKIDFTYVYGQVLLWQTLSMKIRYTKKLSVGSEWIAFAADLNSLLRLYKTYELSLYAGLNYLSELFFRLYTHDLELKEFNIIKNEFKESLMLSQMSLQQKKVVFQIFGEFYLKQVNPKNVNEANLYKEFIIKLLQENLKNPEELNIIFLFANQNIFVNDSINPETIKTGFQVHQCKNCLSLFQYFQWSCENCGAFEALIPYLDMSTESAFYEQNWSPYQDNRNRCAHTHTYPQ